jgi:hypothetical protein
MSAMELVKLLYFSCVNVTYISEHLHYPAVSVGEKYLKFYDTIYGFRT